MGWFKKAANKFGKAIKKVAKKVGKALGKAAKAVVAGVRQLINAVKEGVNWTFGVIDFVATLLGLRLWKKLRLRVVILRDESGVPLATDRELAASIVEARRVLRQTRTRLVPASGLLIETLDESSPSAALDVHCEFGAWKEDFGDAGWFFAEHKAKNLSGWLVGYAAPVTAFIVRDVGGGKRGCSLGPLADYVTVDLSALGASPPRTVVHELGHSCGLGHVKAKGNLMLPNDHGDQIKRWQEAVFRLSRHVTYL